ncbi:phosphonate metabolism protein [Thioclava marina]|uniref:Phosphonate metabolism protein n=1 Tax=Thioclava marina TaxID=1915077 RepID=A0ABX3MHF9_9RHOB|nr:DUF1045 domain-containing protein [Thioclava marina]OOY10949.1 phosphonate metabolism protein [Thioclava marina]
MGYYTRYAIYYAPRDGLMQAGSAWLGWDAVTGAEVAQPQLDGLPLPLSEITETPRKYGFHATIKAPFRLAEGLTGDDLGEALGALAGQLAPVTLDGLEVARLGDFLALRPVGDVTLLQAMAGEVVERLDRTRAPLSESELAKRNPEALSDRQRDLLECFGYPYVFEQFQMHLTLSGRLSPEVAEAVAVVARREFAPYLDAPHVIDSLCLFGEAPESGRFHLLHRYALTG